MEDLDKMIATYIEENLNITIKLDNIGSGVYSLKYLTINLLLNDKKISESITIIE